MKSADWPIDKTWTLFLDRDGVINERRSGDYVTKWEEFVFLPGVKAAMAKLSGIFGTIVVVSNQQGIGKGLMCINDVEWIHRQMKNEISAAGGRIDKVYYCPYLESEKHPDRKPGTGMAFKAKNDFPSIDFHNSVMVGDDPADMIFGKKLAMLTVFVGDGAIDDPSMVDAKFSSLADFARSLK